METRIWIGSGSRKSPPPIRRDVVMEQSQALLSPVFFSRLRVLFLAGVTFLSLPPARAGLWTTAYYTGYEQSSMPASNVDFSALTHIIHFSVVPNSNGTLNSSDNSITAANSADIVSRAHAAGIKVLLCVGGADSEGDFQPAA